MPTHELDDETRTLIALSLVPGVGSTLLAKMIAHFGSAQACCRASERELRDAGLNARRVVAFLEVAQQGLDPDHERLLNDPGLSYIRYDDPDYPRLLRTIYDPPPLLYMKGDWVAADARPVAIVGTRRASERAESRAFEIGAGLARHGVTVVSGLAEGIDGAAHEGALDGGGRTIAVQACGLQHLYPPSHQRLAERIVASGAILSELPMTVAPMRQNFLPRNRLISGMSVATVVVEAPLRSGALSTANLALEQGREVLVVPWEGGGDVAAGSNGLLDEGATPVRSAEDVLDVVRSIPEPGDGDHLIRQARAVSQGSEAPSDNHLARVASEAPSPAASVGNGAAPQLSGNEAIVWDALTTEPTHIDALVHLTGLPVSTVGSSLLLLEMKSLVRQYPGKRFARKGQPSR